MVLTTGSGIDKSPPPKISMKQAQAQAGKLSQRLAKVCQSYLLTKSHIALPMQCMSGMSAHAEKTWKTAYDVLEV